jgi:hypothetical protein
MSSMRVTKPFSHKGFNATLTQLRLSRGRICSDLQRFLGSAVDSERSDGRDACRTLRGRVSASAAQRAVAMC